MNSARQIGFETTLHSSLMIVEIDDRERRIMLTKFFILMCACNSTAREKSYAQSNMKTEFSMSKGFKNIINNLLNTIKRNFLISEIGNVLACDSTISNDEDISQSSHSLAPKLSAKSQDS